MQRRFVALRDDFQAVIDGAHYDLNELRDQDLNGPDPVWNVIVGLNLSEVGGTRRFSPMAHCHACAESVVAGSSSYPVLYLHSCQPVCPQL